MLALEVRAVTLRGSKSEDHELLVRANVEGIASKISTEGRGAIV